MQHAQLWKRILNEGIFRGSIIADHEQLTRRIITSPIIVGPMLDLEKENQKTYSWEKYSGICLPFKDVWIESPRSEQQHLLGAHCTAIEDKKEKGVVSINICFISAGPQIQPAAIFMCAFVVINGKPQLLPDGSMSCKAAIEKVMLDEYGREACQGLCLSEMTFILDILMMLGCKNVSLAPHDGEKKQVARAIKRHGGNADSYRYHTLVVRPPGAKSDSPGVEIGIMPRHVCRAHFMHYGRASISGAPDGKDRGLLFGKYEGRYFFPPTMKGDKKNGVVEKDYEIPIQPPAQ